MVIKKVYVVLLTAFTLFFVSSAYALGLGFDLGLGKNTVVAAASPYLDGQISSTCFEIDATDTDSYAGTGTAVSSLISSPPAGCGSNDYSFTKEAGISFNASPPYFETDGTGDGILLDSITSSIMASAHRTDTAGVWFAIALQAESTPSGTDKMFGNSGNTLEAGTKVQMDAGELIDVYATNGTTQATLLSNLGTTITASQDIIVIVTWDGTSATNNVRGWFNAETVDTNSVALQTSTSDSAEPWSFMAIDSGLEAGWRMRAAAGGTGFLTDEEAALLKAYWTTKHGVDYST